MNWTSGLLRQFAEREDADIRKYLSTMLQASNVIGRDEQVAAGAQSWVAYELREQLRIVCLIVGISDVNCDVWSTDGFHSRGELVQQHFAQAQP
jgi:hypothetical protein